MTKTSNSPLDMNFVNSRPSSSSYAVSEAMKQSFKKGNPIRIGKDNSDTLNSPRGETFKRFGYDLESCNPTASESAAMLKHPGGKVEGLQGSRLAASVCNTDTRRVRVEKLNPVTGETETLRCRIVTNKVSVISYGVVFHFVKTNRGQTVLDSRTGKRISQSFAKSELTRLLGEAEGTAKFAELIA